MKQRKELSLLLLNLFYSNVSVSCEVLCPETFNHGGNLNFFVYLKCIYILDRSKVSIEERQMIL